MIYSSETLHDFFVNDATREWKLTKDIELITWPFENNRTTITTIAKKGKKLRYWSSATRNVISEPLVRYLNPKVDNWMIFYDINSGYYYWIPVIEEMLDNFLSILELSEGN